MSNLEAAQYYAKDLAWPIFPINYVIAWDGDEPICSCGKDNCNRPGKHPMHSVPGTTEHMAPNGHKNATTNLEQIAKWWTRVPDANIGLATGSISGVVVLDCDKEDGRRFLKDKDDNNEIPRTWRSRSGGGGYHVYFTHPGFRVSNTTSEITKDVDIRGDGGYIILPPSNHESGQSYRWVTSPPGAPGGSEDTKPSKETAPPWLMNHMESRRSTATMSDPIPDKIIEGARDQTLTRLAGMLKKRGLDTETIRLALHSENRLKCDPPLPDATVDKIVRSSQSWDPGNMPIPERRKMEFFDRAKMAELEPPEWLVDGILTKEGLSTIYGDPGIGKTFAALDLAMCISYGLPWHGHEVKKGPIVYIAAEGATGLAARMEAWEFHHELDWRNDLDDADLIQTLPMAAQLIDAEQQGELLQLISEMKGQPVLIVVDTLARSMVGGEENSAKDVGMFINAADRIKESTRANVLMIHHAGKDGSIRGSTALSGAADTMIKMKAELHNGKKTGRVDLICEKQKDFEEFDTKPMRTKVVEYQEFAASLVLIDDDRRPLMEMGAGGKDERALFTPGM